MFDSLSFLVIVRYSHVSWSLCLSCFASFPPSCISSLSVVCPSALLEFIFLFFLCRWLRSVLSSLYPLLSFFTEVALPCACSGFPVSLHWSVLLLHSLGFLSRSLWYFCVGVLFFSPIGILCMGFRCPYSLVSCSVVSSFGWGFAVSIASSLWLCLYLRYLLRFPLRFLIWPLLGPFLFFLFFGMVLSCCCSVPAVFGTMLTVVFHVSSLDPCILGFLRFVSLLSFLLLLWVCPASSSLPLGLVPVCSGSVSFLRHRLPVLSCLSFSPLLVDSPPPAFLGSSGFRLFCVVLLFLWFRRLLPLVFPLWS